MRIINKYFIAIAILAVLSCSNEESYENTEIVNEVSKPDLLAIDLISDLPQNLVMHTKEKTKHFVSMGYSAEVKNSVLVSYSDSPIQAIFTKLVPVHENSIETFHIYFMRNELASLFDILISSEQIGDNKFKYTFLTKYGEKIGELDIDNESGRILRTYTGFVRSNKSWSERFENCVEWTISQMNSYDKLACFTLGPICAGAIASMCAVGASEGKFETPEQQ